MGDWGTGVTGAPSTQSQRHSRVHGSWLVARGSTGGNLQHRQEFFSARLVIVASEGGCFTNRPAIM